MYSSIVVCSLSCLLQLDGGGVDSAANNVDGSSYAQQDVTMMLRNRERALLQLADLNKRLDAVEKVELYRRVKSGAPLDDTRRPQPAVRSFSRPAHGEY